MHYEHIDHVTFQINCSWLFDDNTVLVGTEQGLFALLMHKLSSGLIRVPELKDVHSIHGSRDCGKRTLYFAFSFLHFTLSILYFALKLLQLLLHFGILTYNLYFNVAGILQVR